MNKNYLLVLFSLLLIGCNIEYPTDLHQHKGVWLDESKGVALSINDTSLTGYHYSQETCSILQGFNTTLLTDADKKIRDLERRGDQLTLVISHESQRSLLELTKNDLPTSCHTAVSSTDFNPEFIFEHSWHMVNDYYPFLALRGVDWQSQWENLRPRVHEDTSPPALAALLTELISPINDGNVSLQTTINGKMMPFSPAQTTGWRRHAEAVATTLNSDTINPYQYVMEVTFDTLNQHYTEPRNTLKQSSAEEIPLRWGRLAGNIGYVNILSMTVTDNDPVTKAEATPHIQETMKNVFNDIEDTDSLIIDLRFNDQGNEHIALALADYFADQERIIAYAGSESAAQAITTRVNDELNYTKPIVLITGPNTRQASELLAFALKTFPHVQHLGETSAGMIAQTTTVTLSRDWHLTLPYQGYYRANKSSSETIGLLPESVAPTTSFSGPYSFNVQPAINQALVNLGINIQDIGISKAEFDQQIAEIMNQTSMPGLSIAWIDHSRMVSHAAYGLADIDSARPVNVDTPFTTGSISKTFIGTSAMQMIERNMIGLDTTLGELDISFNIDHPYRESKDISLYELMTHTSGIKEQNFAYLCGTYLDANQQNLYTLYDDRFTNCPSPVETNQNRFLKSMLTASGSLYTPENFIQTTPGNEYFYSNIGSALAAEMLTSASSVDFSTWTENNIFAPLEMKNTHWFSNQYDTDNVPATRYLFIGDDLIAIPEYSTSTWADGDLKSSASDLANYLLAIINNGEFSGTRILTPTSVQSMLNTGIEQPTLQGARLLWFNDDFLVGFTGGNKGVYAQMSYDQHNNMGLILLFNLSDQLDDERAKIFTQQVLKLKRLVYRRGISVVNEN